MKKRILIVDDEPRIVQLLENRFTHQGKETLKAFNGIDCINIVENNVLNLILLDVFMPKWNGVETYLKLLNKDKLKSIPVIFMTAYPDIYQKYEIFQTGLVEYISKPILSKDFEKIFNLILA